MEDTTLVNDLQVIAEELNATTHVASNKIEHLADKSKLHEVILKINEIIDKVNKPVPKARDRGPESTRVMTEEDARRVILGDMKEVSHKNAAIQLGLAYGQIYSARKGFTFKEIHKEIRHARTH